MVRAACVCAMYVVQALKLAFPPQKIAGHPKKHEISQEVTWAALLRVIEIASCRLDDIALM
jgi:hypothetical protein